MQSQLVCSGCRNILLYPRGAPNVSCALCHSVTPVPSPGPDMAQLICGNCRTLLMYVRGATSVSCSCCHTVNLVGPARPNQVAHINCGNCQTTLVYPYGAPSVKCAVCRHITHADMGFVRVPTPQHRSNGATLLTPMHQQSSLPMAAHSPNQTVVVENPMTVDSSGKLVSNVVVGIMNEKI